MNTPTNQPTDDLVEALAKIEHDQWMHWSQAVSAHVPETIRAKWQGSWVDYNQLTDEVKEADRVWARKVVTLLREFNEFPS
jgi:hypothetical protein